MVVYADVLIVVNLIVDYFLLKCSNLILKEKPKLWRIILGSGVGAVFSLYIFFLSPFTFNFSVSLHLGHLFLFTFSHSLSTTFMRERSLNNNQKKDCIFI